MLQCFIAALLILILLPVCNETFSLCLWAKKGFLGMTFAKSFSLWKIDSKVVRFFSVLMVVSILRLKLVSLCIFGGFHALYL
jgi:hypothetical protein